MNKQLTELRAEANQLYAEWERTRSQETMKRWLAVNDQIMALVREALGG